MTKLTWTTEKPTEAGWYWYKTPNHQRAVIGYLRSSLHWELGDQLHLSHPAFDGSTWSGPIPAPEEP